MGVGNRNTQAMKKEEKKEDTKETMYTIAKAGVQADMYAIVTKEIGQEMGKTYGHEMRNLVLQLKEASLQIPTLAEKPTRQEELMWSKDYDLYLKKKEKYEEQKSKVFSTILGRCEEAMKNRVEAVRDFERMEEDNDVVALLQTIKELAFDSNDKKYPAKQATAAWKQLMNARQQDDESLVHYYQRFLGLVEHVERSYGEIVPSMVASKDKGKKSKEEKTEMARDAFIAYAFMEQAHRGFKPLIRDLENDFALGAALYPQTLEEALQILTMYSEQPLYKSIMKKPKKRGDENETPDMSFAQLSKDQMRKQGLCFKCGKKGHRAFECNEKDGQEEQNQQHVMSWMD